MLVQQSGKGKIYLNMMNGEIPEFRDILFMTLATHPDIMKEKPEMLRKVAQVFTRGAENPQGPIPSAAWRSWARNIRA